MKIICFLSILGISVLTGCATQPPSQDEIIVTSSERLYDKSLAKAEGVRSVPVKITRDSGLKGFLETAFIKIDGEYVVWLNAREQMTIYLSEGGYIFEVLVPTCKDVPACTNALDVTIKKGVENNFRIQVSDGVSLIRSKT